MPVNNMDTNQALNILQGQVEISTGIVNVQQNLIDALNLAITQLQGTLQTQLTSLTPDQLASFPQVADLQAKVATLTQSNTDLTASNVDIQAKLDDVNSKLSEANAPIATPAIKA